MSVQTAKRVVNMKVNTLRGKAHVIKVHSVPAPFLDGVIKTKAESKAIRYTALDDAIKHGMHSSMVASSIGMNKAGFARVGDSHGKHGRKTNKIVRGNRRWDLL